MGGVRLQALVTYLALHAGAPQSRLQLAARFWPDASDAQGRNNLRQLLHQLRQAWPEHEAWIDCDARAMQWRSDPRSRVDAVDFEREFAAARAMSSTARGSARARSSRASCRRTPGISCRIATTSGSSPIASACTPPRWAPSTSPCVSPKSSTIIPRPWRTPSSMLRLDPLEERAYLRLMRLHALEGDPSAVERVYASCVATLQRELGVAPGPEIRDAHARLARRGEPRPAAREISRRPRAVLEPATPLVGRAAEWQKLRDAWHQVQPRTPLLALVTGEAGLGKTRLGEEMLAWADAQGIAIARTRAYAAEGRLAFSPITGWLRSEAVRESLARLDPLWRTEVARLVAELLVEQPDAGRGPPRSPSTGSGRSSSRRLARAVTGAAPALVLLIDDLQWCDGDTLEFLHYLLRFAADVRLLVVGTIRIDEIDAQHAVRGLSTALRRTDQLVEIALDGARRGRDGEARGPHRRRGSRRRAPRSASSRRPKAILSSSSRPCARGCPAPAGQGSLPPKVHAVITGRLNQLSPDAREVAGLAADHRACLFHRGARRRASDLGEARVTRALDELWQRRIVRDGATVANTTSENWDFTHDRLREVAASELGPIQRQRHHRRIAEALERCGRTISTRVSAEIASHFEQAREAARALPYYERAARVATRSLRVRRGRRRCCAGRWRCSIDTRRRREPALELPLQIRPVGGDPGDAGMGFARPRAGQSPASSSSVGPSVTWSSGPGPC